MKVSALEVIRRPLAIEDGVTMIIFRRSAALCR